MRQRIENRILITCEDLDLTTLTNMEVYIEQRTKFFQYVPRIIDEHSMLVIMPLQDSKRLDSTSVKIQMAFTDEIGTPRATGTTTVPVSELLKEAGYDPA